MSRHVSDVILIQGRRPKNREELFNLRHSSARNVIERIFGVLKRRFRILLLAPEYSLEIQARIPAALAAIHNFIRSHDPDDNEPRADGDTNYGHSNDEADPLFMPVGEVDERRDQIAQAMWDDYRRVCEERGIGDESDESADDDEFNDYAE